MIEMDIKCRSISLELYIQTAYKGIMKNGGGNMSYQDFLKLMFGKKEVEKKRGRCEGCYRMAELETVYISSFSGHGRIKHLCPMCAVMARSITF